jgi:UPF0755 protein
MRRFLLLLVVAALGLTAVAGGALFGWLRYQAYIAGPGPAAEATTVVLPRGVGLVDIVRRLNEGGVIAQPWLFQLAVQLSGQDRRLKAGEYEFPAHASPTQVIAMLAEGRTVRRRLTIAEGLTVAEIYRQIEQAEGLTGALPLPVPEGSLLPETYHYSYGDERAELVGRMQASMTRLLDELWAQRAQDLPIASPEEALTLASIVDKETGKPEERELVAAVFSNRLREGMKLQADPTTIYGLTEGQGPLGRALTRADWQHESAYNTYLIDGLPPTPIANPGRASIEAVLKPAAVDYLYFVADGSGGHAFASDLDEHNRNVARWRKIRDSQPAGPAPAEAEPEDEIAQRPLTPSAADAPAADPARPAAAPPPDGPPNTAATGRQSWTAPLPARPE